MNRRSFIFLLLISLLVVSCKKENELAKYPGPKTKSYSFFVAGHTYGAAGVDNIGLHPPFLESFDLIRSWPSLDMGILTGDVVSTGADMEDWDEVASNLDDLEMPIYIAPGNHDVEDRPLFESLFGNPYYSWKRDNDLFIVLDPNLDGWNISGAQLTFLQETLDSNAQQSSNIFVFFHQLIWWDEDNIFGQIALNSTEGRNEPVNFWTDVEPLFHALDTPVIMFAGDMGAAWWAHDVMYFTYDNIQLVGSGMGEGPGDNFIIVDVTPYGVKLNLIALGVDDYTSMGDVENYLVD